MRLQRQGVSARRGLPAQLQAPVHVYRWSCGVLSPLLAVLPSRTLGDLLTTSPAQGMANVIILSFSFLHVIIKQQPSVL